MRLWPKRILTALAILLFGAIVFSSVGIMLYKATPAWYSHPIPADRADHAAQQAESVLTRTTNWAAMLNGDAVRASLAQQSHTPAPASRVADSIEINFTEEQLNALLEKWSTLYGWRARYRQFISDPRIILRDDRLILAANVKDFGAILSFHFAPSLDDRRQLRFDLVRVMGGKLPLPAAVWESHKTRIIVALLRQMPLWRTSARIDPQGAANPPAMFHTLARMVLHSANHQPAGPILFLPRLEGDKSVPVQLTDLKLQDRALTLSVRRLTPEQIDSLRQSLHKLP
jgi:hypothetical protein